MKKMKKRSFVQECGLSIRDYLNKINYEEIEPLSKRLKGKGIDLNDDLGLIFPKNCFRMRAWILYKNVSEDAILPSITMFEYFVEHGNHFALKVCRECYYNVQCTEYQDKTGFLLPSESDKHEAIENIKKVTKEWRKEWRKQGVKK